MANEHVDPPICGPDGQGMIFPMGGEFERNLPTSVRGFLYLAAMVYWFYGIAIISDLFMSAIETVTSRRIRKKIACGNGGFRTVQLWNKTVATLTLMALGSSAPEIFLSIIDICKKRFYFGTLGPATIVGSASFNLLVIIAVCICVIPSDEVRVISNLPAFYITALFSMVAYLWMAFVILGTSPDIIDLWEAIVTLLMLPALVYISWKVDIGAANPLLRRAGILGEAEEEEDASNNEAGFLSFSSQELRVEGSLEAQVLEILVLRHGSNEKHLGAASCQFKTEPMSAVEGFDFESAEGSVEFGEGETRQHIKLSLLPKSWRAREVDFLVVLEDAEGGPCFNPGDDGGGDQAILTVVLGTHGPRPTGFEATIDRFVGVDKLSKGLEDWKGQFRSCCYCGGSAEEQAEATPKDWAVHIVSLPWNVFFALVPPTVFAGGWACFFGSLIGIAFLTACVSDLAELFGCVLSVPDIITAITFVAMGTSMPDLFASISAAKEDPTADASIVNVTGSNSVNVFLGLGVPWTVAALFWKVEGRTEEWEGRYPVVAASMSGAAFVVQAGELAFAVISFCLICILALVLLHLRRRWLGAELGGPFVTKAATSGCFIFLWVGWVAVVSGQVLRWGQPGADAAEVAVAYSVALVLAVVASAIPAYLMRQEFARNLLLTSGKGGDAEDCTAADDHASEGSRSKFVQGDAAPSATSLGKKTSFDFVGVQHGSPGPPKGTRGSCTGNLCGLIYQSVLGGPKP
mmetsp:Transcript_16129/g.44604  ORF Transcript_16129/g.44604 Transcript_16129/m.44604 type:complete len:746 (-) Transcript_16129:130-2367(-)